MINSFNTRSGVDVIARNYSAGKQLLNCFEWDVLYIDHDLNGIETGYDLIMWAIHHHKLPKVVIVTSTNHIGVENIRAALLYSAKYKEPSYNEFWDYKGE